MQILNALQPDSTSRWRNHPAVKMWRGWELTLEMYHDFAISEWVERGFNNSMNGRMQDLEIARPKPFWLTEEFCSAHRCNLLRKNYKHYSQFNWPEMELDFNNISYIWPVN